MRWSRLTLLALTACSPAPSPDVTTDTPATIDATADGIDTHDTAPDRVCTPCTDPRCRSCSGDCCLVFDDAGMDGGTDVAVDVAADSGVMCERTPTEAWTVCDAACVDLFANNAHCAGCNFPCPVNSTCMRGACFAPDGGIVPRP